MSKKANPALIGAFVLFGLIIGIAAVAVLGSGALFKQTERYVLYFDGSLDGLDPGAPVEFRGVKIGSVSEIRMEYETESMRTTIPVYIEIDPSTLTIIGKRKMGAGLAHHIERGLRAQLQTQSFLTGKRKVMLVLKPDSPANLVGADPKTRELPTVPTLTDSLVQRLEKVHFDQVFADVNSSLDSIAKLLSSDELKGLIASSSKAASNLEKLLAELDTSVPTLMTNLNNTTESLNATLADAQGIVDARSPMRHEFTAAIRQIAAAAQSTQELMDYLQRHPEALLAGKGTTQRSE